MQAVTSSAPVGIVGATKKPSDAAVADPGKIRLGGAFRLPASSTEG